MRKLLLAIICVVSVFGAAGCTNTSKYHEDVDKQWLTKQVQKGKITRTDADKLYIKLNQ